MAFLLRHAWHYANEAAAWTALAAAPLEDRVQGFAGTHDCLNLGDVAQ